MGTTGTGGVHWQEDSGGTKALIMKVSMSKSQSMMFKPKRRISERTAGYFIGESQYNIGTTGIGGGGVHWQEDSVGPVL
jgi:hypothetical protein